MGPDSRNTCVTMFMFALMRLIGVPCRWQRRPAASPQRIGFWFTSSGGSLFSKSSCSRLLPWVGRKHFNEMP
jgi:hypothetical protein